MSNYQFDTIVARSEAEALKEMIFKRARERASALNEETQDSYVDMAKNDIMDLARNSFVAEKNPFSVVVKEQAQQMQQPQNKTESAEIEAAKARVEEIKSHINYRNKVINENMSGKEAEANMIEARESLSNKQSFMGALAFLNSQATISLVNKKGERFSALA